MFRQDRLHRLNADKAAVSALIEQLDAEDAMTRVSLEARRQQILNLIEETETEPEAISADVFFGGRPVAGTRGINSRFAFQAISNIQDLVTIVWAQENGELKSRGIVRNQDATSLQITGVTRGSFGFTLEEASPLTHPETRADLASALENALFVLNAFGARHEGNLTDVLLTGHQRMLSKTGEFFKHMQREGATLRMVAQEATCNLNAQAVARAADRAKLVTTDEPNQFIRGRLAGILPAARDFEFESARSGEVIKGKVHSKHSTSTLTRMSREWVDRDAEAHIAIRRVFRNGVLQRERYTLLDLILVSLKIGAAYDQTKRPCHSITRNGIGTPYAAKRKATS